MSEAAAAIYGAYSYFSEYTDEALLLDHTAVGSKVSSLTDGLLNVVSLSR